MSVAGERLDLGQVPGYERMARRVLGHTVDWLTTEHWLVGASLSRILLGCWGIYYYLLHYPVRHLLWGPNGFWPHDRFVRELELFSVWQLSPEVVVFEALYAAGVVIALLYSVGLWPRLIGLLHWVMIWSLQERNPLLGDGGDNFMRIVLLFLVLANTGAHFSPHAGPGPPRPGFRREIRAVAHNAAVLIIIAQLAFLYMSTGLYKAMGELWQNGTALYYILRVRDFSWPGVAEYLYRNPFLVVLGTYGTVLFEVTFAPLLLNRWTRYIMILSGVAFHTAIALVMGLVTFGWSMLSIYPLLLTDNEYLRSKSWLASRIRLTVFYDGWCSMCIRSVRLLGRLDLLGWLTMVSFRDQETVTRYPLDLDRLERRMQVAGASGKVREGMDAVLLVISRLPPLWPLLPLLAACRLAWGQRAYDWLATRRLIIVPGACGRVRPCKEAQTVGTETPRGHSGD
mgnify:CR=1 FL=1